MNPLLQKRLPLLALLLIVVLNAVALSNETTVSRLDTNDAVDHYLSIQGMAKAAEHGGNPLDWFTDSPFGYPVIRDYQPFAYILVVGLYFLLGKSISLLAAFIAVRYLSIVLLPLSFYAAARWMELPRWTAVAAALLAPLLATQGYYGLEYESYIWQGFGLFTQAVAANFLILAIGLAFRAVRHGRPLMLTGVLLGLTFVSNLMYGYMGAASVCLIALLSDRDVARAPRIWRTVAIGAVAFVISLFELVPLLLDGKLLNPSHFEHSWKNDSFGAAAVLKLLFTGELMDHNRIPVLSVLMFAGVAVLLWKFRKTRRLGAPEQFALSAALFWLLAFFGRATWGPLVYLIGIPKAMHMHRFIAVLQVFLVLLAAVGLVAVWRAVERRFNRAAAAIVVLVLLSPLVYDRLSYLDSSRTVRARYLSLIDQERPALDAVVNTVKQRGGYVYAGLSTNWGNLFRVGGGPIYSFLSAHDVQQTSFPYHVLELSSDMMTRFDELQPSQYRLFDVRSVITPAFIADKVPSFLKPILSIGRFKVFDAPATGYFDVVDAIAAVPADRQSFYDIDDRWLHSGLVAQRGHLLLDFFGNAPAGMPRIAPADSMPPDPNSAPPGEVSAEHRSGDVFHADFNAVRPAFALFRMSWHQNWKATLDGHPAPTFMLTPGFIGVPVGPGSHQIDFRYQPDGWRLILAWGCGLGALLLVAAERFGILRFPQTKIEAPVEPPPEPEPAPKPVKTAGTQKSRRSRR